MKRLRVLKGREDGKLSMYRFWEEKKLDLRGKKSHEKEINQKVK